MIYKLTINQENDSVKINSFATKKDANGSGNGGILIASAEDLLNAVQLTGALMAEIYNSVSETAISKFSDRETGARRTFEALEAKFGQKEPEKAAKEPKIPAVVAPKKEKAEKSPKKDKPAPKAKIPREKKPGLGNKGTRRAKTLALNPSTANPYRIGSKSFTTFELILANPGSTYGELVAKGARANTVNGLLRDGLISTK